MNRQINQKYGFVIALVIAGISLPISIISLTRELKIINNNYYNTYYNQTYYVNNETNTEPDYSKPLETVEYYNLTNMNVL